MLLDLSYLFVVGSGWFLAIFLFFRGGLANRFYSIMLMIIMYEILMQYIFREYDYRDYLILFHIRDSIFFLYGVFLYFYILAITKQMQSFTFNYSLHMLPGLLVLGINCHPKTIPLSSFSRLVAYIDNSGILRWKEFFYICVFISAFTYLTASLRIILIYRKRTAVLNAYDIKILRRGQLMLIIYGYLMLLFFAISTVLYLKKSPYSNAASHFFCAFLATPVYFSGYISIVKNGIFDIIHKTETTVVDMTDTDDSSTEGKYARSRLSESASDEFLKKILHLINTERVYLNPELTLNSFAQEANISPFYISQVISLRLSTTFISLINEERIAYAKKLLIHPEHAGKTILEIAFISGFNSKTTFNTQFKEISGITPSEFRKTGGLVPYRKPLKQIHDTF